MISLLLYAVIFSGTLSKPWLQPWHPGVNGPQHHSQHVYQPER